MALRMILTAMVVSMSLPLPRMDTCRSLVEEMNRELAAALNDVGTEIVSRFPDGSELVAVDPNPAHVDRMTGETTKLSIDATFANILEEFANEAVQPAVEQNAIPAIEQVAIDARRIPIDPVRHPLPPATEALELLPSAADLIRSVSEELTVRPVDSATREWLDIAADRCGETDSIPDSIEMVRPVVSADIGPWESHEEWDESVSQPIIVTDSRPIVAETQVNPVDSLTSEWAAVVGEIAIEDSTDFSGSITNAEAVTDPEFAGRKSSTIRDAFRKTAEAIALWSKVMTRPY